MSEPDRPRFRFLILDLVVFVAASAVGVGGYRWIEAVDITNAGRIAFWLVFAGVGLVGYLAARFGQTREVRMIVMGLAVAFAGAADAMFLDSYMFARTAAVASVFVMGPVALALVVGGVIAGLRTPPRPVAPPAPDRPKPHPLDEDAPR